MVPTRPEAAVDAPPQIKTVSALYLVAGVINISFGWIIASSLWTFGAGMCTGLLTCGACPIGVACGVVAFAVIPVGLVEIIAGIIGLTNPDGAKGLISMLPFGMVPSILLGDIISPIVGVLALVMLRNDEVRAYLEG